MRIWIIFGLTLAIIAILAFIIASRFVTEPLIPEKKIERIAEEERIKAIKDFQIYELPEFQGNTADIDAVRFFRIQMVGVMRIDIYSVHPLVNDKDHEPLLTAKIKDLSIITFSSKTFIELQDPEVKSELKTYMIAQLNTRLGEDTFVDLFYKLYIIQ